MTSIAMKSKDSFDSVDLTAEASFQLRLSVHSQHDLRRAGYILAPLSPAEIEIKKRCEQCCKALTKKERHNRYHAKPRSPLAPVSEEFISGTIQALSLRQETTASVSGKHTTSNTTQTLADDTVFSEEKADNERPMKLSLLCKYHSGRVKNREWTCCNKPLFGAPCTEREKHVPRQYKAGELERTWLFHETPHVELSSHVDAVAIDCEMGTTVSGDQELIRVSVVNYFTRAVLLDKLVYPSVQMAHYNTRFSGVTRQAMEGARRRRSCLFGRDQARHAVQQFVGPNTVVIGHSLIGDLSSLRWIHPLIVDTHLLEIKRRQIKAAFSSLSHVANTADDQNKEADAEDLPDATSKEKEMLQNECGLSLKALTLKKLGREIQVKGRGHDSVEDALAARDLAQWYMSNPIFPST